MVVVLRVGDHPVYLGVSHTGVADSYMDVAVLTQPSLTPEDVALLATPAGFCMDKYGWTDMYDWQIDVMNSLTNRYTATSLRTCNGAGKAQPVDTWIPMYSGDWKRLGDLEVGDYVIGSNGLGYPVTNIYDRGQLDVYRVTFDDGDVESYCCEDHLWKYMNHNRRFRKQQKNYREWGVVDTKSIMKLQRNNSPVDRGIIPVCAPVQYEEKDHLIPPYTFGALLGDGTLRERSIGFSSADPDILLRVQREVPYGVQILHNSSYDFRIKDTRSGRNELLDSLRSMGVSDSRSHEKFIPDEYLYDSVENRIALLNGLMDTDGSISKNNCVEFCTTSKELASDVCLLIHGLGGKACKSSRVTKCNGKKGRRSWRVRYKHKSINPFWLKRKASRFYEISYEHNRIVYDVSHSGMVRHCRCIEVASPDNTYLTNDYIVTHNTSIVVVGLALWHMRMFPGAPVIYTSASNRQIQGQLFPRIKGVMKRHHPNWKVREGNEYSIEDPETGSKLWCFATDDEGKAEGWHPQGGGQQLFDDVLGETTILPELFIILDEMKSIHPGIINALRVRCRWTREFDVSSPGLEPTGAFYDNFRRDKDRFKHPHQHTFKSSILEGYNLFKADVEACPHLCEDKILWNRLQLDRKKFGDSHPLIQSSYFAEFGSGGERQVFNMEAVDDCMSEVGKARWGQHDCRGAVDLSGGGDETVLGFRQGNAAKIEFTSHERNHIFLGDELIRRFKTLKRYGVEAEDIFADQGGLGAPIINYIRLAGWHINFFNFGSKPKDPVNYLNARAEMAFELAELISAREIILPNDDILREQFGWITWEQYNDRTLKIIPKAKMPGSPDRVDVMKMLFYNIRKRQDYERVQEQKQRRLSPFPEGGNWEVETANTDNMGGFDGGIFF